LGNNHWKGIWGNIIGLCFLIVSGLVHTHTKHPNTILLLIFFYTTRFGRSIDRYQVEKYSLLKHLY